MKRYLIYSLVGLAVAAGAGIALAHPEGRDEDRGHGRGHRRFEHKRWALRDVDAPDIEDANRPRHCRRRGRMLRRIFRARIEHLESVREIAIDEGATKTVEALDEVIARDKQHFRRMGKRMREWRREHAAGLDDDETEGKPKHHHERRGRHRRTGPDMDVDG